jgi:arylsulfatase A-like enzyme
MYGVAEDNFVDAGTISSALDVIRRRQTDKPWCHYIGNLGPHDAYFPPREFLDWYDRSDIALPSSFADKMFDKPGFYRRTRDRFDQLSDEEHKECIRHYLALCSYEDHLFGQVLDALEESGEADNTVVIYCSDHGDYMGDHGLWCKGLPAFRGAYEVPLLVRWPGVTDGLGRIEDRFVSLTDIAPTILEMAGVQVEREFSGVSLAGLLRGEKCEGWRDAHFTQFHGAELYGIQRAVWTRDWKLVFNGFDYDELYDLRNDPGEIRNLAREPGMDAIRRELYGRLWEFGSRHDDPAINSYIMTGLAEHGPGAAFTP